MGMSRFRRAGTDRSWRGAALPYPRLFTPRSGNAPKRQSLKYGLVAGLGLRLRSKT